MSQETEEIKNFLSHWSSDRSPDSDAGALSSPESGVKASTGVIVGGDDGECATSEQPKDEDTIESNGGEQVVLRRNHRSHSPITGSNGFSGKLASPPLLVSYSMKAEDAEADVFNYVYSFLESKKCPYSLAVYLASRVSRETAAQVNPKSEHCHNGNGGNEASYFSKLVKSDEVFTNAMNNLDELCLQLKNTAEEAINNAHVHSQQVHKCSIYATRNGRRKMEDRHTVIHNLNALFDIKSDKQYSYYAIFDGHAGVQAATFAASHLHSNLARSAYFNDKELCSALCEAFSVTDLNFLERCVRENGKSGTTAIACLFEQRQRMFVGWVGDSLAYLYRDGKPIDVTYAHRADNIAERERVIEMGGIVTCTDSWRVNGALSVTRAIGDPEFKPYISSDADVKEIKLSDEDELLVIACDGLWDHVTPEEALEVIYKRLAADENSDEQQLNASGNSMAETLSDAARNEGSNDNITVIVVYLCPLNELRQKALEYLKKMSDAAAAAAAVELDNVDANSSSSLNPFANPFVPMTFKSSEDTNPFSVDGDNAALINTTKEDEPPTPTIDELVAAAAAPATTVTIDQPVAADVPATTVTIDQDLQSSQSAKCDDRDVSEQNALSKNERSEHDNDHPILVNSVQDVAQPTSVQEMLVDPPIINGQQQFNFFDNKLDGNDSVAEFLQERQQNISFNESYTFSENDASFFSFKNTDDEKNEAEIEAATSAVDNFMSNAISSKTEPEVTFAEKIESPVDAAVMESFNNFRIDDIVSDDLKVTIEKQSVLEPEVILQEPFVQPEVEAFAAKDLEAIEKPQSPPVIEAEQSKAEVDETVETFSLDDEMIVYDDKPAAEPIIIEKERSFAEIYEEEQMIGNEQQQQQEQFEAKSEFNSIQFEYNVLSSACNYDNVQLPPVLEETPPTSAAPLYQEEKQNVDENLIEVPEEISHETETPITHANVFLLDEQVPVQQQQQQQFETEVEIVEKKVQEPIEIVESEEHIEKPTLIDEQSSEYHIDEPVEHIEKQETVEKEEEKQQQQQQQQEQTQPLTEAILETQVELQATFAFENVPTAFTASTDTSDADTEKDSEWKFVKNENVIIQADDIKPYTANNEVPIETHDDALIIETPMPVMQDTASVPLETAELIDAAVEENKPKEVANLDECVELANQMPLETVDVVNVNENKPNELLLLNEAIEVANQMPLVVEQPKAQDEPKKKEATTAEVKGKIPSKSTTTKTSAPAKSAVKSTASTATNVTTSSRPLAATRAKSASAVVQKTNKPASSKPTAAKTSTAAISASNTATAAAKAPKPRASLSSTTRSTVPATAPSPARRSLGASTATAKPASTVDSSKPIDAKPKEIRRSLPGRPTTLATTAATKTRPLTTASTKATAGATDKPKPAASAPRTSLLNRTIASTSRLGQTSASTKPAVKQAVEPKTISRTATAKVTTTTTTRTTAAAKTVSNSKVTSTTQSNTLKPRVGSSSTTRPSTAAAARANTTTSSKIDSRTIAAKKPIVGKTKKPETVTTAVNNVKSSPSNAISPTSNSVTVASTTTTPTTTNTINSSPANGNETRISKRDKMSSSSLKDELEAALVLESPSTNSTHENGLLQLDDN